MFHGKKILGLLVIGFLFAGCAKKEAPAPKTEVKPEAPPTATTTAPAESAPKKDFVPPKVTKKQAKYFPEGTPSRAIQDLDDTLESYVLNPKNQEDRDYNANLKRYVINGTFDIRELCRLALGKHWDERTPEEQNYFVDLMIRLLEKKAIFSKEQGQKKKGGDKNLYKVTYEGDKFLKEDKSVALARSVVHVPSEALKIGLDYKLRKVSEEWKIFDVVVDGASLVDNYKYQFDKIISKDGYPTLIHRMESKLKDLESKGAVEEAPQVP